MAKDSSSKMSQEIEALSFEKALAELEAIVQKLEAGDVELEESIEIYERGTLLKAHCEAKLANAQSKIEKITLNEQGSVQAEPAEIG